MDKDKYTGKVEILHRACKKWIGIFLAAMLGLTILSRFLDSIIIPQVTVQTPIKSVLQYQIKGSGILEAQESLTVAVLSEISIRSVTASQGQEVSVETPLFAYQMDELERLYVQKLRELQQSKLALESERLSAQPLPKMSEEELAHQELEKAQVGLTRAQEKLGKADLEYQHEVAVLTDEYDENLETSKEDLIEERKKTYEKAEHAYELAKLNKRLENKTASWEYDTAVQTLERLEEEGASDAELRAAELAVDRAYQSKDITDEKWTFEIDMAKKEMDDAYDDWQSLLNGAEDVETALKKEYERSVKEEQIKLESMEEELTAAADAYRDAQTALENARKNDSYAQKGTERESELSVLTQQSMELDIAAKEQEADQIKTLLEQDGVVYAPYAGVLTAIDFAAESGRVQIGSGGILMKAEVDTEQAKQLTSEINIQLKRNGRPVNAQGTFQSLEHDPEKGNARLTIALQGTGLTPGTELEYVCESKSEPYDVTIPLDALRQDQQGTYVLLVEERNTVLGTESRAVRYDVTVIAKTKDRAVLEGGISSTDRFIAGSSKQIQNGSRVRVVTE